MSRRRDLLPEFKSNIPSRQILQNAINSFKVCISGCFMVFDTAGWIFLFCFRSSFRYDRPGHSVSPIILQNILFFQSNDTTRKIKEIRGISIPLFSMKKKYQSKPFQINNLLVYIRFFRLYNVESICSFCNIYIYPFH